ncbi:MAG: GNAT family N-acetyltransferase [Proteobacteria bacterium]|nr:GNAT family N-acetyltransferase [Pseudomonadota bacterium]
MIAARPARRDAAASLTAICLRSKAHWEYDAESMRLSTPAAAVDEVAIGQGHVLVGCNASGRAVGLVRAQPDGETATPGLMFVDPPAIGTGVGCTLFEAATALAPRLGATRPVILADPNAAPFSEWMGARFLRNAPPDAIPGRTPAFYEYDLTSGDAS